MILADADWIKPLGGALVVLFMALAQLVGWIAKKKEEQERKRRANRPSTPPPLTDQWSTPTPPPTASDADRRASAQQDAGKSQGNEDRLRKANKITKAAKAAAQAKVRVRAEAQMAAARISDHQRAAFQAPAETTRATPVISAIAAPVSPRAADIRKWLAPKSLRQQMVLAEVLGPPVALREPRYQ